MKTIEQVLDVDAMRGEIADLGEQVAAPDLWDDQANATRVTGRLSALQGELDRFTGLGRPHRRPRDHGRARPGGGRRRRRSPTPRPSSSGSRSPSSPSRSARCSPASTTSARRSSAIRSGAGGVDAADFAEMLMRMYTRWAEQHKYAVEVYETSYAEEAGLKSATFAIHAPYAYGTLSVEAGTHRLVRISPFDNQGRRQTSLRRRRGGAGARADRRDRDPRRGHPRRRLPLRRPRRSVGQHHRLRGPADAHPDRHRRLLPEREVASCRTRPAPWSCSRPSCSRSRRPRRRRSSTDCEGDVAGQLGRPDAQLRAQPVPDRQGPAHRLRGRQPAARSSTATSTASSRPASAGAAAPTRPTRTDPPGRRRTA